MIALVFLVIAFSTASESIMPVWGFTSAKTGFALQNSIQFADAINDIGDVITSSPSPTSKYFKARNKAAVQEVTPTAKGISIYFANLFSKSFTEAPVVRKTESRTFRHSSL